MNTKIKAGVAALLAAGSMAATAAPANAYGYWGGHGGYYGHGRGYGGGALLGAGIAGLAVGAALAAPHYGYGYGPRYYGPAYYGYGTCLAHRTVWDPYYGGYVVHRVPVPC
jgi:hypothetical protein